MKIKQGENLAQTECCLQTFDMLTPRSSGKSLNFHMPTLSLLVFGGVLL